MKAVIMAGGKGTRLRPLTCHLPKPMVPLLNRPCMEYIIDLLKMHGITDIAVTMQYLPDAIRDYFGDGSEWGVRLHYFEETAPLGTAGSVKNAQSFLDERFVVISGDALTDADLTEAVAFHEQRGALATLVLSRVNHPLDYGVVMIDETGRIVRFLEKPGWGEVFSDTVNTGIYILEPELLARIEPGIEYDFSSQLFPALLEERAPLFGYVSPAYWSDIGNLQQYRQAQFDMLDGRVNVKLRGKQIQPGIFVGENVRIHPKAKCTGPAFIGDHCIIDDGVEIGEYCIIGSNNRLSRGSSVTRTILWDRNHIAEKNEFHGCTLASGITCQEGSEFAEGSVIGSHCLIGPKSLIAANVKIWPKKQIHENSRLHTSCIWGEQPAKTLYRADGVTGEPNVQMTPEFAARFATAYGSTLARGKTVAVSSCADRFSGMIKGVVAASLQSAGVHVVDLGVVIPAVARYGIGEIHASGGIHVQRAEKDGRTLCCLECYDEHGLPISREQERKVENSYWQEDYGRVPLEELGSFSSVSGMTERYVRHIAGEVGFVSAREEPYLVVLAAGPAIYDTLRPLLETLNCDIIHASSPRHKKSLTALVRLNRADLGLWIADDGRRMQLVTEHGNRIPSDALTILQYLSYFHLHPGHTVGVPVSAPHLVESLAEGLGGKAIRTKENTRSVMEVSTGTRLHPLYDAVYAAAIILRHLDQSGLTVSQLAQTIPSFYLLRERIDCPWDAKGRVMRVMMEKAKQQKVDLLDGIKFYHDNGWVLLLPDSDEPVFKVIAQSERPEWAQALVNRYRDEILDYIP